MCVVKKAQNRGGHPTHAGAEDGARLTEVLSRGGESTLSVPKRLSASSAMAANLSFLRMLFSTGSSMVAASTLRARDSTQ